MFSIKFPPGRIASCCAFTLLAACSGGGGSSSNTNTPASSGSGATGQATVSGTVTGFGSVIVDGLRIDNRSVAAGREFDDGTIRNVELKLGQHVEVEHDGDFVASRIRVDAEIEGAVTAVNPTARTLSVLGQIVFINTDPALGPVTLFDAPYASLANVAVSDVIEVHALIKTDAAGKVTFQATRIEKKLAEEENRIKGLVSALSTGTSTFKLGDLTIDYSAARLEPAGVTLTDGAEVKVGLPPRAAINGTAVKALVVKVKNRKGESEGKNAELGGPISSFDPAARTMRVNGVLVDLSAASFKQNGRSLADLRTDTYVVVKGTYIAGVTGPVLKASTVVIRGVDQEKENEVEIHGTILNFKSSADFTLRGVRINASNAAIDDSCAPAVRLGNDLQVSVKGNLLPSGQVVVRKLECEAVQDGQSSVEREGVAGRVDAGAGTFALTTSRDIVTVQFSAATIFRGVSATTLEGKRLEVEGTLVAGVLRAEKIALED